MHPAPQFVGVHLAPPFDLREAFSGAWPYWLTLALTVVAALAVGGLLGVYFPAKPRASRETRAPAPEHPAGRAGVLLAVACVCLLAIRVGVAAIAAARR